MDFRASAVNPSLPLCGPLGLPCGSITTGIVGMIFGCLAFWLGVRAGHLTAERRLPLGYSAQEGERKIGVSAVAAPIFDSHGLAFVVLACGQPAS
jgi:hypothetical protein